MQLCAHTQLATAQISASFAVSKQAFQQVLTLVNSVSAFVIMSASQEFLAFLLKVDGASHDEDWVKQGAVTFAVCNCTQ